MVVLGRIAERLLENRDSGYLDLVSPVRAQNATLEEIADIWLRLVNAERLLVQNNLPVTVVVGKNFKEIVLDDTKDVLLECLCRLLTLTLSEYINLRHISP